MGTTFDRSEQAFAGINYPSRAEAVVQDLVVEGQVPADLNGAYYRLGPDPAHPPTYQGFLPIMDGDGMMVMFGFRDGQVDFRSRYVQTQRYQLEHTANRSLYGPYRNPFFDDPSVRGTDRGEANTTTRMHAGILWALKEDSLGISIEPLTLRTLGVHDFDGHVTSKTMTAHPKLDPRTGEMIFYGAAAKGETTPDIAFYIADRDGKITAQEWFQAPYASMVHDFAVTEKWIIFPVMPCVSNLERLRQGGPIYDWEPERGMYLGIMPRDGSAADVRWVHSDARWFYHVMNAYDDDDVIRLDVAEAAIQPFPWFHVDPAETWNQKDAEGHLTRWTINPRTGSLTTEQLLDCSSEFPRLDERFELGTYRHGYLLVNDPAKPEVTGYNSVGHYDHHTSAFIKVWAGKHISLEEPQFVPRSTDAPEGDGYLLAIRHHADTMLSDLIVIDTADFTAGPIAVVALPFRVRPGTHGTWIDEADLVPKT